MHRLAQLVLGCALAASPGRADPVLFLVAEPEGSVSNGDSYVLPLEDPAAIAHARDLIALGPEAAGAPIAVAEIAAGADGINRDHRAPGAPEWSWHVTGFEGFADSTIEVLDGWPGWVEQDVAGWIANTGGAIGFWTYTVVEELPEPPADVLRVVSLAALALAAGALRRWRATRSPQRAAPGALPRPGNRFSRKASTIAPRPGSSASANS